MMALSADDLDELRDSLALAPETTRLWVWHAPVVELFLAVTTQFRFRLMPTRDGLRERCTGLDYAGVGVAAGALGIALEPTLWRGLRTMELAAAAALNGEEAS